MILLNNFYFDYHNPPIDDLMKDWVKKDCIRRYEAIKYVYDEKYTVSFELTREEEKVYIKLHCEMTPEQETFFRLKFPKHNPND